jgi:hypothetical protein
LSRYSTKEEVWSVWQEVDSVLGQNRVTINEEVYRVELLFVSDKQNSRNGKHTFLIDNMFCATETYATEKEIYSYIELEEGATHFRMEKCAVTPPMTRVSSYISRGEDVWTSIDTETLFLGIDDPSSVIELEDPGMEPEELLASSIFENHLELNARLDRGDYVERSLRVFRNRANGKLVRGLASGWKSIRGGYECVFYLPTKTELDFGPSSFEVDGVTTSGRIVLLAGFHRFWTASSNWYEVEAGATSIAQLRNRDPLYPHNHKHILDGYAYDASYGGNKVYVGFRHWESELKYSSTLPESLEAYTLRANLGLDRIVLSAETESADWENEYVDLFYRTKNNSIDSVYVKHVLESDDSRVSPELKSFTLYYV